MRKRLTALFVVSGATSLFAQMTEVPTTAEKGRWLVEADVATASYDQNSVDDQAADETSFSLGSVFLSTGVTSTWDIQAGYASYLRFRYDMEEGHEVYEGPGDFWVRSKWNFWGNEYEGPALAVLPYVKFPTNSGGVGNDETEWGFAVPFGMPLGQRWSTNAMAGVDWLDDREGGRDLSYYGSAVVMCTLDARWTIYGEAMTTTFSNDTDHWVGVAGVGVAWQCLPRLNVDLAVYGAVTKAAPDWQGALRIVINL